MNGGLHATLIGLLVGLVTAYFTYRGTMVKAKSDEQKSQYDSMARNEAVYAKHLGPLLDELQARLEKIDEQSKTISKQSAIIISLQNQVKALRKQNVELIARVQKLTQQVHSLTRVETKELKEVGKNAEKHQK